MLSRGRSRISEAVRIKGAPRKFSSVARVYQVDRVASRIEKRANRQIECTRQNAAGTPPRDMNSDLRPEESLTLRVVIEIPRGCGACCWISRGPGDAYRPLLRRKWSQPTSGRLKYTRPTVRWFNPGAVINKNARSRPRGVGVGRFLQIDVILVSFDLAAVRDLTEAERGPRGGGSGSRRRRSLSTLGSRSGSRFMATSTAASATGASRSGAAAGGACATAAAMTVEQAEATTMAAAAAVATGATTVATGAAAALGVAAAATMMTPTGRRLVVNAHQGDANHREENRDAEQESTIHSKFLQKTVTEKTLEDSLPPCQLPTTPPSDKAADRPGGCVL
jgi:hypothetical protein